MVEEVQNHLWEMLESGAISPSQSAWCNTVVLVQKKDGGLQFCIDFCHLNPCMKKDSYPLPRIQEALESLVGVLKVILHWSIHICTHIIYVYEMPLHETKGESKTQHDDEVLC